MIIEYIQSEELYKGFILKIRMRALNDCCRFHRSCEAWKDDVCLSIGKTKKEMKELIDGGYIK